VSRWGGCSRRMRPRTIGGAGGARRFLRVLRPPMVTLPDRLQAHGLERPNSSCLAVNMRRSCPAPGRAFFSIAKRSAQSMRHLGTGPLLKSAWTTVRSQGASLPGLIVPP